MPEPIKIKVSPTSGVQNIYNIKNIVTGPGIDWTYALDNNLGIGDYFSLNNSYDIWVKTGFQTYNDDGTIKEHSPYTAADISVLFIKRMDLYKNIMKQIAVYFKDEDNFQEHYSDPWKTLTEWRNSSSNLYEILGYENTSGCCEIAMHYISFEKHGLKITIVCSVGNSGYGNSYINWYVSAKGTDGTYVKDKQYFNCNNLNDRIFGGDYSSTIFVDDGNPNGSIVLSNEAIAFYMINNSFAYSLFDGIRNDETTILTISGRSLKGDEFWVSMMSNATSSTSATMISTVWSKIQALNGMKVYCCSEDVCSTSVDGTSPLIPISALPLFRIFCYSPSNGLMGKLNAYDTLFIKLTDGENYVQQPSSIGLGWFFPLGFLKPVLGAKSDKESSPTTITYLITLGG